MGQPLSMDLRTRLLSAIDAGMSCRSAAVRFGALDGDPVAGAATHDWEFCAEASGRGHTFAWDRRASGGILRHMGGLQGHHP